MSNEQRDIFGWLKNMSFRILNSLGYGHSEKVYQEALAAELRAHGWTVELERCVPILYLPTNAQHEISVGFARLDILARKTGEAPMVIELKTASSFAQASLRSQIQVYRRSLEREFPNILGFGIQFMQPGVNMPKEQIHIIAEPNLSSVEDNLEL